MKTTDRKTQALYRRRASLNAQLQRARAQTEILARLIHCGHAADRLLQVALTDAAELEIELSAVQAELRRAAA